MRTVHRTYIPFLLFLATLGLSLFGTGCSTISKSSEDTASAPLANKVSEKTVRTYRAKPAEILARPGLLEEREAGSASTGELSSGTGTTAVSGDLAQGVPETGKPQVRLVPAAPTLEFVERTVMVSPGVYEIRRERVMVKEAGQQVEVLPPEKPEEPISVEFEEPYRYSEIVEEIEVAPGVFEEIERIEMMKTVGGPARAPYPEFESPDELWILVRPKSQKTEDAEALPRTMLVAHRPAANDDEKEEQIELPLQHTKVRATIAGILNTVQVTQQYENPLEEKIEVTYQFPLPTDAAVTDFIMTVGERTIRGIIREREEAEDLYEAARAQGHVASLMTEERPNIFQQKVANIEPGARIDLEITYFNALQLVDGYYEFVFPMTIGPRYNPPGTDDGIGAEPQGHNSKQPTTITYLPPGQRSGNDIDLEIDLNAGMVIQDLDSPTHEIDRRAVSDSQEVIRLAAADQIPNRDFVLRYRLSADIMQTAFLWHDRMAMPGQPNEGDYFVALIEPPDDIALLEKQDRELIFVVDCSGSMNGEPMAKAKQTMRKAIRQLEPDDSFAILKFSEDTSTLSDVPLPATPENIEKGLAYIEEMSGKGGTHMRAGIEAALHFPQTEIEQPRQRIITFMTDGYIGNEAEIFQSIDAGLGDARVFSFGVGSSVNRYLLEGLSSHGRGAAAFISLDEDPTWVVDSFYNRIAHAALMNPEIDWNGMLVSDVYPSRFPDILPGRPLLVAGRSVGPLSHYITLRGTVAGRDVSRQIPIDPVLARTDHAGLTSIWARKRIEAMQHHEIVKPEVPIKHLLTNFSIENSVLSTYTAFIAIDSATKTNPDDPGIKVQQPNRMPEGVRFDTTVGDVSAEPEPREPLDPVQPLIMLNTDLDDQSSVGVMP